MDTIKGTTIAQNAVTYLLWLLKLGILYKTILIPNSTVADTEKKNQDICSI